MKTQLFINNSTASCYPGGLSKVQIYIKEDLPQPGGVGALIPDKLTETDEGYNLTIQSSGEAGIFIQANQYSGVMRALSSLAQVATR